MHYEGKDIAIVVLVVGMLANGVVAGSLFVQVDTLKNEFTDFQNQAIQTQIQDLLDQLTELNQTLNTINSILEDQAIQIENCSDQIDELLAHVSSLINDLELLSDEFNNIADEMSALQQQLSDLSQTVASLRIQVDNLETAVGLRDFGLMDYNIIDAYAGPSVFPLFVVDNASLYLGGSMPEPRIVMKERWSYIPIRFTGMYDDISQSYGNYTVVAVIWSAARNVSTNWDSVEALVSGSTAAIGYYNYTMANAPVHDVIEMVYSPFEYNSTHNIEAIALRLSESFPTGEYRILIYLREA